MASASTSSPAIMMLLNGPIRDQIDVRIRMIRAGLGKIAGHPIAENIGFSLRHDRNHTRLGDPMRRLACRKGTMLFRTPARMSRNS